jgi:hypothetical protein
MIYIMLNAAGFVYCPVVCRPKVVPAGRRAAALPGPAWFQAGYPVIWMDPSGTGILCGVRNRSRPGALI